MTDSVQPHRQQPTRLPCPWDSPGKNTGVGCHFLLQCVKVKSESEVAQSCPTLRDPMDCSLPGFSAHGIFQARVLEWVAIAFSTPVPTSLQRRRESGLIVQILEHRLVELPWLIFGVTLLLRGGWSSAKSFLLYAFLYFHKID